MLHFYRRLTGFGIAISAALLVCPASAEPLPPGGTYEIGFSPGTPGARAIDKVEALIDHARSQVLVAAYELTSKRIARALIRAERRSAHVFVVADRDEAHQPYSLVQYLADSGIPVRLDGSYKDMHSKFTAVDSAALGTGSFNYSERATFSNEENVIVFYDAAPIVQPYEREWKRMWDESTPLAPRQ
jgi:phosphatidylserine/phosphatidylglycerophosphate/cardiolipin synthase-like enzyme